MSTDSPTYFFILVPQDEHDPVVVDGRRNDVARQGHLSNAKCRLTWRNKAAARDALEERACSGCNASQINMPINDIDGHVMETRAASSWRAAIAPLPTSDWSEQLVGNNTRSSAYLSAIDSCVQNGGCKKNSASQTKGTVAQCARSSLIKSASGTVSNFNRMHSQTIMAT